MLLACPTIAQVFSFETAAQCRERADAKNQEGKALGEQFRSCPYRTTKEFLARCKPLADRADSSFVESMNIRSECSRLQIAEDSRARQEKIQIGLQEQQAR